MSRHVLPRTYRELDRLEARILRLLDQIAEVERLSAERAQRHATESRSTTAPSIPTTTRTTTSIPTEAVLDSMKAALLEQLYEANLILRGMKHASATRA